LAGGVVVGVHRAVNSGPVVQWAAEEARRRQLPLRLVHAWKERLDISLELGDAPGVEGPVEASAEHGSAAAVLLAHDADLLVLGGHPTQHVAHTTQVCLRQARCPVAIIPDLPPSTSGQLIVGVDFTASGEAALRWAVGAAALRDAEVIAVHAFQLHPHSASDVLHPARALAMQRAAVHEQVRRWVHMLVGTSVSKVHVVHGAPLDVLRRAALDAELLILGRGEHHGLGRVLHAAISADLSALAPAPLVVVPMDV
jgi:nucleotide-binding universal stress UspA family protein